MYCGFGEFHCENDRCITMKKRCDGKNDCGDMSDEKNCGMSLIYKNALKMPLLLRLNFA